MRPLELNAAERSPRDIAAALARRISTGDLAPGDRLPTVRALASELGVSPATVSHAWQSLSAAGLIVSRGRSGSFVRSTPRAWLPPGYQGLEMPQDARLDLSRGTPDPALLPPLAPALSRYRDEVDVTSYQRKPDIPALHDLLRSTWPSPVESITVTNGALDAIDRALAALTRFGDRVVVETPTFPPFLDLLEHYGLDRVPVALDAEGMRPDAFQAALSTAPAVVLLQPRAHNPTGVSMSPARAERLASLLHRSRVAVSTVVIEDDHSGAISTAPDVSLARHLPERVLHVRSFSKSHGPDLRIGAIGGPRTLVDLVVARRLLGPGWTSRMVQSVLFDLLTEPESVEHIARARDTYAARYRAIVAALGRNGVSTMVRDGINMWLPVRDERAAIVQLAAIGIRVAPGGPFQPGEPLPPDDGDHVRVTTGVITEEVDAVAAALAAATVA